MRNRISTVTSAASSLNLVSLPDAKAELGIPTSDTTQDTLITRFIGQASAMANSYCNRVFVSQAYQDQFRLPGYWNSGSDGYGRSARNDALIVANMPIISVTSITEDGAALTVSTDYEIDAQSGLIYRLSNGSPSRWCGNLIVVAYTAGYATIPADVADAALRLLTMRFKARDRDPMLREREGPVYGREVFWTGAPQMTGSLPADIGAALTPYCIPTFG